jgi:hypothetical protein
MSRFYLIRYIGFTTLYLIRDFLISLILSVRPQASRRSPAAEASAQEGEIGRGEYLEKAVAAKEQQKTEAAWSKGSHERRRDVTATQQPRYGGFALPEGNHVDG